MTATGWLRTSYRVGAAVDALAAAQMVAGSVLGCPMMHAGFTPGDDYRYAIGMGAALMVGWTALLVWADRSPLERRGVLPITAGVVALLAANELVAVRVGFLRLAPAVAIWTLQGPLVVLFLWSWAASREGPAPVISPPSPG